MLGWWIHSLKSTKFGFKSWLCRFPSLWQQASDKFFVVLQNEANKRGTYLTGLLWCLSEFIYTKVITVHRATQENTRKYIPCVTTEWRRPLPRGRGGEKGRFLVDGAAACGRQDCWEDALGPWMSTGREKQSLVSEEGGCCLSGQLWTALGNSRRKGLSVGKKGSDHGQPEHQGEELGLCPMGSQLRCEALGRAWLDQTQV